MRQSTICLIIVSSMGLAPLTAQPTEVPKSPQETPQPEPPRKKANPLFAAMKGQLDALAAAERAESRARDAVAEAVSVPEKMRLTEALQKKQAEVKAIKRTLARLRGDEALRASLGTAPAVSKHWHAIGIGTALEWVPRAQKKSATPKDGHPANPKANGKATKALWAAVMTSAKTVPSSGVLVFAVRDGSGAVHATHRVPLAALRDLTKDHASKRASLIPLARPAKADGRWTVALVGFETAPAKPTAP